MYMYMFGDQINIVYKKKKTADMTADSMATIVGTSGSLQNVTYESLCRKISF